MQLLFFRIDAAFFPGLNRLKVSPQTLTLFFPFIRIHSASKRETCNGNYFSKLEHEYSFSFPTVSLKCSSTNISDDADIFKTCWQEGGNLLLIARASGGSCGTVGPAPVPEQKIVPLNSGVLNKDAPPTIESTIDSHSPITTTEMHLNLMPFYMFFFFFSFKSSSCLKSKVNHSDEKEQKEDASLAPAVRPGSSRGCWLTGLRVGSQEEEFGAVAGAQLSEPRWVLQL